MNTTNVEVCICNHNQVDELVLAILNTKEGLYKFYMVGQDSIDRLVELALKSDTWKTIEYYSPHIKEKINDLVFLPVEEFRLINGEL